MLAVGTVILTPKNDDQRDRIENLLKLLGSYDPAVAKEFVELLLESEKEFYLEYEIELLMKLQAYLHQYGLEIDIDDLGGLLVVHGSE